MKVYRVQAVSPTRPDQWVTRWEPTQAAAAKTAAFLADVYVEVVVERMEIGAGRESLCEALNASQANRTVWSGERIR